MGPRREADRRRKSRRPEPSTKDTRRASTHTTSFQTAHLRNGVAGNARKMKRRPDFPTPPRRGSASGAEYRSQGTRSATPLTAQGQHTATDSQRGEMDWKLQTPPQRGNHRQRLEYRYAVERGSKKPKSRTHPTVTRRRRRTRQPEEGIPLRTPESTTVKGQTTHRQTATGRDKVAEKRAARRRGRGGHAQQGDENAIPKRNTPRD